MRRLIILRHAKADPRHRGDARDRERKLAPRGLEDAPRLGHYLAEQGIGIDMALVSDSARTQETFALAGAAYGRPIPLRLEPGMYDASASSLLTLVRASDDDIASLLLVGHNPGFAELANALAGTGEDKALSLMRSKFPTAALAIVDFDVAHWAEIALGGGRLERFVTPAMLGSTGDD
jgi:phosphohistidine phosphatase